MKVLLRNGITLEEALKENASIVDDAKKSFYYLPCWFEKREDKLFMHHINDIPQELKDLIMEEREGNNEEPIYVRSRNCKDFANAVQPLDERELNNPL